MLGALSSCTASPEASQDSVLIENVRIFDSAAGTFTTPSQILIHGNRIEAVGRDRTRLPTTTRIDAAGRYAVPGFWDCHVHLSMLTLRGDSAVTANLEAFVQSGITNVRDVGGSLDTIAALTRRVSSNMIVGPRISYAGPILSQTPLDSDLRELNGAIPGTAVVIETPAEIDSILDSLVRLGASLTKAYDRWDPDVLRYYVAAATRRSLPVVMDLGLPIFNPIPIDSAIFIGVASIEHAKAAWYSTLRDDLRAEVDAFMVPGVNYVDGEELLLRIMSLGVQSVDLDRLSALAARWSRSGVYYCPTINVAETYAASNLPEQYRSPFEGLRDVSRLFVRELAGHGVKVLVGQDSPGEPERTLSEMEMLARAGVPPLQVLRGATLHSAQSLGIEDRFGSLETGKMADVVLLDANPLEQMDNIRSVWQVVYDGKPVLKRNQP
jgi:imidazolonepropionase-like amidohydrolase